MGGFLLARHGGARPAAASIAAAERSFARQGHAPGRRISTRFAEIVVVPKRGFAAPPCVLEDGERVIAAVGTLIYRNAAGERAARQLAEDLRAGAPAWRDLFGQYCLIVADAAGVRLFTDACGLYHVFHDTAKQVVSSSLLAILEGLPQPRLAPQAVFEYVFQESTYGGATLLEGVVQLDCRDELLIAETAGARPLASRPAPRPEAILQGGDVLERNLANLRRTFAAVTSAFNDRIDTALSGGYDSRLMLALLREQGARPRLHVYGAAGDPDVAVAKAIAAGEGIALTHTDKGAAPRIPQEDFASHVLGNLLAFDGAPADGVFDGGADLKTRMERCAGGELMLNGGGGEVFRDFFHLPDRALTARELLWTFYSQFDPAVLRPPWTAADYYDAMESKVRACVGSPGGKLSRADVEFVYPAFRCRFWMGRNNSNNNRLGHAMTPFIDANVVPDALRIPLAYKRGGRFEAQMIQRVDPRLAAYPSVYGHHFAGPPPLRRAVQDWLTTLRPPWLRRLTFRLKHRAPQPRPYFLDDAHLKTVLDTSFPCMARYFDVARVHHNGQFNRLCTLELLCQTFSVR